MAIGSTHEWNDDDLRCEGQEKHVSWGSQAQGEEKEG